MIYIIAYDIADNKRRLRVAKTLESWGYRIQESVFQLRLDTATLARARSARRPHLRRRRRHPHLPHLLVLRRHTRRGHSAGRCGVVPGSVVKGLFIQSPEAVLSKLKFRTLNLFWFNIGVIVE